MQTIEFKELKSVNNPNSIHGIYPYRGKISAIDAEMIIKQLPKETKLLDPFCGTGTIVYEAKKLGLNSYGVDLNPIAHIIANGKINIPENINQLAKDVIDLVDKAKKLENVNEMNEDAKRHFHLQTANEIMRVYTFFNEMNDYVKSCFFGAISLTARGCNGYLWTSTSVGKDKPEKDYINFYEKFLQKVRKHHYPVNHYESEVYLGDARNLSKIFKPDTFDFVFTSPPYFDCLDYTSYYTKIVYNIMDYNRLEIKSNLIQNFKNYENDMQKVLNELYIVCKTGAKIIFVVGDKKIHNKLINGAEFFNKISPFKTVDIVERTYANTSSKVFDDINKTERKEQIIVWEK